MDILQYTIAKWQKALAEGAILALSIISVESMRAALCSASTHLTVKVSFSHLYYLL